MISIADNYLYWDNAEAVTFTIPADDPGDDIEIEVSIARRMTEAEIVETFETASVITDSSGWLLPAALLVDEEEALHVPAPDHRITDEDDQEHRIQSVRTRRLGSSISHYACLCRPNIEVES